MKKVMTLSAATLGTMVSVKLYQKHDKEQRHKKRELAKEYHPTLPEDLLGDIATKAPKGKKICVVIGGGVAGIASAYELCEKGHNVVLLEKYEDTGLQCSAAPAGGMQRSNPSVDSSMWIAAAKSIIGIAPFQYFKISFWETLSDPHFLRWFAGFTHNSAVVSDKTHSYYQKQLLNFTNWAIDDIITTIKTEGLTGDVGLVETGALKLYFDETSFSKAKQNKSWQSSPDGEHTVILSRDEVLALEPCLGHISEDKTKKNGSAQLVGGALQTSAASGSCLGFTRGMMKILKNKHKDRFRVESNIAVVDFETELENITQIHTSRGTLDVPSRVQVVVTAGSWTPIILRKLGLYCPVYPMKGYNLIVDFAAAGLRESDFPSRVVVDTFMYSSTLNKELRIASFGEFDGWDTDANPSVVNDLKEQAGRMYPSLKDVLTKNGGNNALPTGVEIRTGLRPFVSDGRLLLGKIPQYKNLYVNVGPGFNGWKVATGAAKVLVADITGDASDLPNNFEPSILSPVERVTYCPWLCRLTNFLTFSY